MTSGWLPRRRAIDQLLDKHGAASGPPTGWQRFTSTAMPCAAAQQAGPACSPAETAQDSSWRRTSDTALHSAKAAWGQPAPAGAQESPGSGAWPPAPRAAAKAVWGATLASPAAAQHGALPPSTRGASATQQQRPLQPARRSLTGALTPAAAWDRLCGKTARPAACDDSVWVADGSMSSLEDSDWDVRSSDDRIDLHSSPESSGCRREPDDCGNPPPRSTDSRQSVTPVATVTPWKPLSGMKRRSAAPLPAEPARSQAVRARMQPAKMRRRQAVARDSCASGLQSWGHAARWERQVLHVVADEVDSPPAAPSTSGHDTSPTDDPISDDDGPLDSRSTQPGMVCSRQRPDVFVRQNSRGSWLPARTGALSHGSDRRARQQTLLT